jgi:catechol 2,3-dioxygenase-like lactoylglutathione lyase family enzyme
MRRIFLWCVLSCRVFAVESPVVGIEHIVHSVADLDKSIPLYHDVLGLEYRDPPRPRAPIPFLRNLSNHTAAQFRVAIFKIPGADYGILLSEFTNVERTPVTANAWDPGVAQVIFLVRDIDKIGAALRASGISLLNPSKKPVAISPPAGQTRALFARDADGYILGFEQSSPVSSSPSGNIIGAKIRLVVGDTGKTARFYRDSFGFEINASSEFVNDPGLMQAIGREQGRFKVSTGAVPGSAATLELYEFAGTTRSPLRSRIPDPGAPAFAIFVVSVDDLLAKLAANGTPIVLLEGQPFRPAGRNAFVRDPDGLAFELVQERPDSVTLVH